LPTKESLFVEFEFSDGMIFEQKHFFLVNCSQKYTKKITEILVRNHFSLVFFFFFILLFKRFFRQKNFPQNFVKKNGNFLKRIKREENWYGRSTNGQREFS